MPGSPEQQHRRGGEQLAMPISLTANEGLDGIHAWRGGRWLVRVAVPSAKPRHRGLDAPSGVRFGRQARRKLFEYRGERGGHRRGDGEGGVCRRGREGPTGGARPLRPGRGRGGTGQRIRDVVRIGEHRGRPRWSGPDPQRRLARPARDHAKSSSDAKARCRQLEGHRVIDGEQDAGRHPHRLDLLSHRRFDLLTSDAFQASIVLRVVGGLVDGKPPRLGAVVFEDQGGERRRTRARPASAIVGVVDGPSEIEPIRRPRAG